jgi:hypothetical protein
MKVLEWGLVGAQFVGRCPEGLFDVVEHFYGLLLCVF